MKRTISLAFWTLLMAALFIFGISAQSAPSFSWYCIRNKDHKQPRLDTNMQFIEQYNGFYVDRQHGDTCENKVVYLTFDAGYENGNVAKTLDVLKEENVPGAFFVLGNLITSNPDLIMRMVNEGHTVCNHTYSHKDLSNASLEEFSAELERLETVYKACTGEEMGKFYRPPEGKFSLSAMRHANDLGYKTIFWSFAYADWDNNKQMAQDAAKEKILSNIHNGAIILLHPTSSTNAQILGDVIKALKEQGYEFGTLEELTLQNSN